MIASTLLSLGIDYVTNMVKEHGEDLAVEAIKKVTNIDLKSTEPTVEDIVAIKKAEKDVLALDFEKLKLAQENTNSAREMNVEIQTSENSSSLAKNAAYYLDFAIVGATIAVGFCLFFFEIPVENTELAYTMFGSLLTLSSTVINFHRGSSHGSKEKSKMLKEI